MKIVRVAALLAVAALVVVGCGGDPTTTPDQSSQMPAGQLNALPSTTTTPPAEPQTIEAAKALAQRQADAFSAGDYAGTWDMWTAAGKAAITRDGYVRVNTECKRMAEGVPFTVAAARLENPTTAVITLDRLGFKFAYNVIYEDNAWRWQPDADAMAGYALGVDRLIAQRRADGVCA